MKHLYIACTFLLLVLFSCLHTQVFAQNFHLVKDINASTDANPYNYKERLNNYHKGNVFAVLNGVSYFCAEGINGRGFWRSDGTQAGTYLLKDNVNPNDITVSNGKLFFTGFGNPGLWTSDGTAEGTKELVIPMPPGMYSYAPATLTDFNGTLYFTMSNNSSGNQLWKTDGTSTGTTLVKDFYNADDKKSTGSLSNLVVIKNRLYFTASSFSPYITSSLGVSDGSPAGTYIISSNIVAPAQEVAGSLTSTDSLVYFTGSLVTNGNRSLYVTNGRPGNVAKASGFNGVITSSYYGDDIISKNGFIYFAGLPDSGSTVQGLYKYDIDHPANGVQPVKTVTGRDSSGRYSAVYNLYNVAGSLYFCVQDVLAGTTQLWKSDGSSGGNVLLSDKVFADNLVEANGLVYFIGSDFLHSYELWKTDGTVNGTRIVKDINPGFNQSNPAYLTPLNNKILFAAQDGVHGNELWQSDGTAEGTFLLKDINRSSSAGSSPNALVRLNNKLFFTAYSPSGSPGTRLWQSNGTSSGTNAISDTTYSSSDLYADTLATFNNHAYFFGNTDYGKRGLYKIDGITGVASIVKEFPDASISFGKIVSTGNSIYFNLSNSSTHQFELWRTDGTAANTYPLKQDLPDWFNFYPGSNTLFFLTSGLRQVLWKTDGTVAGTVSLKSFPGTTFFHLVYNNQLFFDTSEDSVNMSKTNSLWTSDGTVAGTVKVTNNLAGPSNLISASTGLFFFASDVTGFYGTSGVGLFKTNGTENGTVLVKDLGTAGIPIGTGIFVNDTLYFFTSEISRNKITLWKSNGTTEGTQAVGAAVDGPGPSNIVSCNGKLLYIIGGILWESNGTGAGTHPVVDHTLQDIALNQYDNHLTSVGSQLFFTAYTTQYGVELYSGNISKDAPTNYISAADGNWSDTATWADNRVPPAGSSVIIKHQVTGNINTTCNGLWIEATGNLTVNPGIMIQLLR